MKKIAAFVTALALFILTAFSVHIAAGNALDTNNADFGTWISTKKDLSYRAVSSNLEEDTVMMMGSSEFQYGNKTPYHPTKVFRDLGMSVMCVGAAENQSLSHAVTLGSVAPLLQNKKVALILSPTWFSKNGVDGSGFAARFSQSEYEELLCNEELSLETRQAVAARVEELLEVSPKSQSDAQVIRKLAFGEKTSLRERLSYATERWINGEKEDINVGLLWKAAGGKRYASYDPAEERAEPDWRRLENEAYESIKGKMNKDFNVLESAYNKKIKPELKTRKDADTNRTFAVSPEYGDLRLFLQICQEEDIEALLILLPLNGRWYDYTGFPKEERQTFVTEVEKLAAEYGVETENLFDQCYEPGFFEDHVHPAGKGWIRINEAAYKFFKET